jgi:uncharacterized membrane protein YqhA
MAGNEEHVDTGRVAESPALLGSPNQTSKKSFQSVFEKYFESFLWSSRFAVLIAVLASVGVGIEMFYIATADTVLHAQEIRNYASGSLTAAQHEELRTQVISHVVEAIDGYLLATVMLIFAFGLYELFISRIDRAGREHRARVLMIHSLDDLKHRLGQVVLLILVVKFFEGAAAISLKSSYDLLLLSVGILLIAVTLYLTHTQTHRKRPANDAKAEGTWVKLSSCRSASTCTGGRCFAVTSAFPRSLCLANCKFVIHRTCHAL